MEISTRDWVEQGVEVRLNLAHATLLKYEWLARLAIRVLAWVGRRNGI